MSDDCILLRLNVSIISIQFYRKCNITENIGNHIKRGVIKIIYHYFLLFNHQIQPSPTRQLRH